MTSRIYFLLVIVCIIYGYVNAGDGFHFTEDDSNPDRISSHDRKPIVSKKCDANELLYPGDKEGTWVCDCKPGYLYYPKTDKCYASHSRGPCKNGEQLILPAGKVVPKCNPNSCRSEREVLFRGRCYPINSVGPCAQGQPTKQVIVVDHSSLQLVCGSIRLATRFEDEEEVKTATDCNLGSKRAQTGACTPDATETAA